MRTLRVQGVTGWDLFASHCPACGKLQVHGFWGQLDKTYYPERRRVTVRYGCRDCGHKWDHTRKLSTGERKRLIIWTSLLLHVPFWLSFKIPHGLRMWILWLTMWLDRRIKV